MSSHERNLNPGSAGGQSGRIGPFFSQHSKIILFSSLALFAVLFPLAFAHFDIYTDEAWLGQQSYSLATHGQVMSEFFRDKPPLDGSIVLYHTLLVWIGAATIKLAGWGLYTLRAVSLISGLLLFALMLVPRRDDTPREISLAAALTLLFTPVFVHQMIIFRPEMLQTILGFASFLLLERGLERKQSVLIPLAGLCAGLSGLSHPAGLAFALAGIVVLLFDRQYGLSALFSVCAALAFLPYLAGLFTNRELFLTQAFHNPLSQSDLTLPWWQILYNLILEHKKWFHDFDVVGISVLFLLALFQVTLADFRRDRRFWLYLLVLTIALAALPTPKTSRYLLPLIPFFALVIGRNWFRHLVTSTRFRRTVRTLFVGWTALFFCSSIGYLTYHALVDHNDRIAVNHRLAAQMKPGSLVMAPFDFVFVEQPNFTIQCYRGAKLSKRPNLSPTVLEKYADSLGVKYLILSPEEIEDWRIDTSNLAESFTLYTPLTSFPDQQRWLVERRSP